MTRSTQDFGAMLYKHFPKTLKLFEKYLYLFGKETKLDGNEKTVLITEQHFFALPFTYQIGFYLEFLSSKKIAMEIQIPILSQLNPEFMGEADEFANTIKSYIYKGFQHLEVG